MARQGSLSLGDAPSRSSVVLGAFRARQLADLIRARRDSIVILDDLYAVARAAGWREQAIDHAVDELVAGVEGPGSMVQRLEQDERGRLVLVSSKGGRNAA